MFRVAGVEPSMDREARGAAAFERLMPEPALTR